MQRQNGDATVDNGHVDILGEEEGSMNFENSIDIDLLSCVKQKTSGKLLYTNERPAWGLVMTWRDGVRGGGRLKSETLPIREMITF